MFIPNNDNNFTAVYFDLIEREDEKIRVDFYTATPLGFMLGDNGLEVIAPPLIDDLILENMHGIYDKSLNTYTSFLGNPTLSTDFKKTVYFEMYNYNRAVNSDCDPLEVEIEFFLNGDNVTAQVFNSLL